LKERKKKPGRRGEKIEKEEERKPSFRNSKKRSLKTL
jgi:hypothetical protein